MISKQYIKTREAWIAMLIVLAMLFVVGCRKDLRVITKKSIDGKTYLAILDDNGGGCGPIRIDGVVWDFPLDSLREIDPGLHQIDCAVGAMA